RLEVRLSTNGASTNVGSSATATGDFTTLLLSINPTLVTNVYPQVWTQYTITLSGLPAPTSGRMAFRYFVTNGGPVGSNSDYIGIDNVVYTPYVCPTLTVNTTTLPGGSAGTAYSESLSQTGCLGAPTYAITAGALPPGLTLSSSGTISGTPTATGTFNFTVTVGDASGCSGSRALSITAVCPANPLSFNALPTLCTNGEAHLLVEGTPAGGTYSGTGVSDGSFDPAAGTQTITYDYTDPYGCAHSTNATITVNTAPMVTSTDLMVCSSELELVLSGATPEGGVYSGTGVADGVFDPAAGTQTLTYTYTDANNCSNSSDLEVVVNAIPTVTMPELPALCDNGQPMNLGGAVPEGGTWSGTGVSEGTFDPASGTQTLTYTYTDANNCTGQGSLEIVVNAAPEVTAEPFNMMCINHTPILLMGAAPAGGTWSGTGVGEGTFNPAEAGPGSHSLVYTYTSEDGCTAQAYSTIEVDICAGINTVAASEVKVFPNPATDHFFIEAEEALLNVRLFSLSGAEMPVRISDRWSGRARVEMGSIPAGIYFVQASTANEQITVRIVKH
ncbi:MAG TPA: putative Ig domain-containing protein, partial [Flavobacteriales bacterium]